MLGDYWFHMEKSLNIQQYPTKVFQLMNAYFFLQNYLQNPGIYEMKMQSWNFYKDTKVLYLNLERFLPMHGCRVVDSKIARNWGMLFYVYQDIQNI